jgi:epoxyqueuosine reductase
MTESAAVTAEIRRQAQQLGFDAVGVCPAVAPNGLPHLQEWIQRGYAGEMRYIPDRLEAYADPQWVLEGARSIVMLSMNYRTDAAVEPAKGQGKIARYAWGEADYHDVIHAQLAELVSALQKLARGCRARGVVDTAPLMEHDFAQRAGLGWIGKNTLLLNREAGSYFFLAALLTDLELDYDAAHETDHCGTCTACLDACPTDAFPQPYVLDATRCISYLTIELRNEVPLALREVLGDWIFGCDICQEVCPWNQKAPLSRESRFAARSGHNPVDLIELFDLDQQGFRQRYRRTPIWRAKRQGLLRNAAIVLGNQRAERAIGALIKGLNDHEPLVRAACAWALGRYATDATQAALARRLSIEADAHVSGEIVAALDRDSNDA